jgi:hypothetical protein
MSSHNVVSLPSPVDRTHYPEFADAGELIDLRQAFLNRRKRAEYVELRERMQTGVLNPILQDVLDLSTDRYKEIEPAYQEGQNG